MKKTVPVHQHPPQLGFKIQRSLIVGGGVIGFVGEKGPKIWHRRPKRMSNKRSTPTIQTPC